MKTKIFNNLIEQTNNITTFGIIVEMQGNNGKYFKADVADSDAGKIIDALNKLEYFEINRSTAIKRMTAEIEAKIMSLQDVFVSELMEKEDISEKKAVQLYHGIVYQVLDELGYRYNVEVVKEENNKEVVKEENNKEVVKEVHKQLEKIVYWRKFKSQCGSNKTFIKNTEYRSKKVGDIKEEIKKLLQSN
ncbi:hypothetical protein [Prevotella pallens]